MFYRTIRAGIGVFCLLGLTAQIRLWVWSSLNLLARKCWYNWLHPDLLFLAFFEFPCFVMFQDFLVFLRVFPFFSQDFRVRLGSKILAFLVGFPCRFPEKQGKEDQGM